MCDFEFKFNYISVYREKNDDERNYNKMTNFREFSRNI